MVPRPKLNTTILNQREKIINLIYDYWKYNPPNSSKFYGVKASVRLTLLSKTRL